MTYKLRHKFAELLKQHATKVIGIIIFLFILSKIDIKEALGIVAKMNVVYFAFVIALLFPFLLLKAYRWKILMKIQSIKFRLSSAFLIYFVGIAFGVFTPGKLGELVKLMYIKNKGYSTGKSFVSVFFDRMLDVLVLIFIGCISMLFLIEMFKNELLIIGSILAIALLFFIVFMLKKKKILKKP